MGRAIKLAARAEIARLFRRGLLLPLLLGVATAAPTGALPVTGAVTHAVVWVDEATWIVPLDEARAYVAPELFVADQTAVWRYRLRTQADRPRARGGLVQPARRWQGLERIAVGTGAVQALTDEPAAAAHAVGVERRVLDFRGEQVTLLRSRRLPQGRHALDLQILALPTGRATAAPVAEATLSWLDAYFPGLVDPCVRRPLGLIERAERRWLVLGGAGECAESLHALPLGPAAARPPSPDGRHTLSLRGLSPQPPVIRSTAAFDDRCAPGTVWLSGPGGEVPLGPARTLSGLRWVNADDPVVALRDTWFLPTGGAPCARSLTLGQPLESAHLCQVEETGRAWGGPNDLSAVVWGDSLGRALRLQITVRDADRGARDRVSVWLGGDGRRPLAFAVSPAGFEAQGRGRFKRQVGAVEAEWHPTAEGYQVVAEVPWDLLGEPPALTVAVDDDDGAGLVRLWAAGERLDPRNRMPAPVTL